MQSKQRGVTVIGWLFLLVPVALVGYEGLRLAPLYLNYMKVVRSMDQIASELHSDEAASVTSIRNALEKHLNIQSVDYPDIKDFDIRRDGQTWVVQSSYEQSAPLFSNISMVVAFDKTVEIH
ncbi:MAG TPA: DUF4845 domain-containing protein [Steroidobacteraceae bacterium]